MTSPACTVQDGGGSPITPTNGADVTPGNTVTVQLLDLSANTWTLTLVGQDELVTPPTLTMNSVSKSATFPAPTAGSALKFQSQVNGGKNPDGTPQPSYTTTFGVFTLAASGNRVLATNMRGEPSAAFGWITLFNPLLRTGGGGGSSGYAATYLPTGAASTTTVTQTSGRILVSCSGITGATVVKAPAAPTAGMSIVVVVSDGSLSGSNTIQFNGNGNHVNAFGVQDAGGANLSSAFTNATYGNGGSLEWSWNGTIWVAS